MKAPVRKLNPLGELGGARVHPIADVFPEDIVIVGYPKSGNTWAQYLVAGAIYGVDTRFAPAFPSQLVPDVHGRKVYRRFRTPTFFKSHHHPRPQYRRVVYLIRDGRDVMVSYLHHLRAIRGEDSVNALEVVQTGRGLFPGKWHEHVEAWSANPYRADMITIRYEDLLADGVKELRRLCEFAEIERDTSHLAAVVERTAFENMRAGEKAAGAHINPRWPQDKPFFRRGEAGSHRDEMSPEVLEGFLAEAGPTLRELGYLLE